MHRYWFLFALAAVMVLVVGFTIATEPAVASTWQPMPKWHDEEDEDATPEATEEATTPPIVVPADPAPTLPAIDPAPPVFGPPLASGVQVQVCLSKGEDRLCIDKAELPSLIQTLQAWQETE